MPRIRVLIADDEILVRRALRIFLECSDAVDVVGEAKDGREAIDLCATVSPHVVLMDIQMPGLNGIEATEQIVKKHPKVRILAVTTFSSERHVVAALRAGASGYLIKDTPPEDIIEAVLDVQEGKSVLSPRITEELIKSVRFSGTGTSNTGTFQSEALTDRELSIVKLLAIGMSNAEMAAALMLSEATVKSNLGRIMLKWGARDRVQVLIHALQTGIVYM